MCAYGPNVLGYGDPDVDEAAIKQMAIADCVTAPSSLIVDFAELMVSKLSPPPTGRFSPRTAAT